MAKKNAKKEQVIDECELCGTSYWQEDLISTKHVEWKFNNLGVAGRKTTKGVLICGVCKKSLDAHSGAHWYKPDHPWSFPTL